jgi:hypothetical protein
VRNQASVDRRSHGREQRQCHERCFHSEDECNREASGNLPAIGQDVGTMLAS